MVKYILYIFHIQLNVKNIFFFFINFFKNLDAKIWSIYDFPILFHSNVYQCPSHMFKRPYLVSVITLIIIMTMMMMMTTMMTMMIMMPPLLLPPLPMMMMMILMTLMMTMITIMMMMMMIMRMTR